MPDSSSLEMDSYNLMVWIIVFLSLAFGICGCGHDPLEPEDLVGVYTLTQFNGASLPFVLEEGVSCTTEQGNPGSGSVHLVSGEFESRRPGFWIVFFVQRVSCSSSPTDSDISEYGMGSNGRYELQGSAITLIDVFGGEETLYATGRASRSTLSLNLEPEWGGHALTFVRPPD